MPKEITTRFTTLGKGKFVHVLHNKAYDLEHSECQRVRKYQVADEIPGGKGISPEAATALDGCTACGTHEAAKAAIKAAKSPAQRRAEADDNRNQVMDRASGVKRKLHPSYADKKVKAVKVKSERKRSMTKSGPRSVASAASGDQAQAKAIMLGEFGDEHGWVSTIVKDEGTGHWRLGSSRDNEVIHTWFIDGKYDINRHAEMFVGEWVGKLRGAHAVRRQMSMEGRDRPHPSPGMGRSAPRRSSVPDPDESPDDASDRVPFKLSDSPSVITAALAGKVVRWKNGKMNNSRLSSDAGNLKVTKHPENRRAMLTFTEVVRLEGDVEVLGAERCLYLNKILRVTA